MAEAHIYNKYGHTHTCAHAHIPLITQVSGSLPSQLPFSSSLRWHRAFWLCPENRPTLFSCPVSLGYCIPTQISILGVSSRKGKKRREAYLETFGIALCGQTSQCLCLNNCDLCPAFSNIRETEGEKERWGREGEQVPALHHLLTYFACYEWPKLAHWNSGTFRLIWNSLPVSPSLILSSTHTHTAFCQCLLSKYTSEEEVKESLMSSQM